MELRLEPKSWSQLQAQWYQAYADIKRFSKLPKAVKIEVEL